MNLYRTTANLYDLDNRDIVIDDIQFYIDYAKKQNGEILELGCGTGRVLIMLAKLGFKVTGLDLSNEMLDVFKDKIKTLDCKNNITLINENMADFNLNKKFSLIISPFRAFQALTDDFDISNALSLIYNHLTDDGLFIINVFRPYEVMNESWCYTEKIQWELDDENGNHIVKTHWGDNIDIENKIIYPHFAFNITDKFGNIERKTEDLKLKYYYEEDLRNILKTKGFKIVDEFGWYDKSSIKDNRELIFICKK